MIRVVILGMVGWAAVAGASSLAKAASLYFDKVQVRTSSERTCFRFASDTARLESFRNVHSNALEVAGEKDGAYVSITCVGRSNQPAVAVVMSVSDSFAVAKRVADAASNRIKGIVCFDSCD